MFSRFRNKASASNVKEHSEVTQKAPFFIVGCVRSGTTMLRDILRRHPNLDCPEETHFFRWGDPFGAPRFVSTYKNNKLLCNQRGMDGISEDEFDELLSVSSNKMEFAENYGRLFLKKQGNPNGRWFDKTPQNVYGILLIHKMFPDSKIIHIHRNPLNVVASLFEGKVVSVSDMSGATSFWIESILIMEAYKELAGEKVLEVNYEEFTTHPREQVDAILRFVDEDPALISFPHSLVHPEKNKYKKKLTSSEIDEVIKRCGPLMEKYGYV